MSATTLSTSTMQAAEERQRRMRLSRRIYDTVWPTSSGVINLTDAAAKPVRGPTREGAYHYPYIEHSTMMDEQARFLGAEDFDSYIDHQLQSLDIANVPMRRNSLTRNQRDGKRQSLEPSRHSMRQLPQYPAPQPIPRKRSNSLSKVSSSLPNSLRLYPTSPHYVHYDQSPDSALSSSHPRSILKKRARGDYADRPRTNRYSVRFSERISYSDDVPLSAASAHPQSHTSYTPTSGEYLPSAKEIAAQVASLPAQNAVRNANLPVSAISPFEREKRPVDIEQWMSGVNSSAPKETRKNNPSQSTSPPPAPPPVRVEGFNPPSPRLAPTHRSPRLSPRLSPTHRSPRQGPTSPNMNGTSFGQRQNTSPHLVASQSVPHLTSPRQNPKRDPRRNADVPNLTLEAPRRNNDVPNMPLDRSNPLPKPPPLTASEPAQRDQPREPARDLQRKPSDSRNLERRPSITRARQDSPPKEHRPDSSRESRPTEREARRSMSGEKPVPQIPNADRSKPVPIKPVSKPVPQLPSTALNIDKSKPLTPSLDKGKTFPQALAKSASPSLDKGKTFPQALAKSVSPPLDKGKTFPQSLEKGKSLPQSPGSALSGERLNGEKSIGSFFIPPGSRRESLTNNISTTWRSLIGNGNGTVKEEKLPNGLVITTSNPLPLPPSLISETTTSSPTDRRA